MCGRARCTLSPEEAAAACGVFPPQPPQPLRTIDADRYKPSYNVSPGTCLPVVRYDGEREAVVHCMKWGLVPSFSKPGDKADHYRMFNARSESVHEKASFSRLLPRKRCLLAVEGFYEWKKDQGRKQPYYVHLQDGQPLVFACLYDSWKNAEGGTLFTFTILTTRVSKRLEWLHDRMPVILQDLEARRTWLSDSRLPDGELFRQLVQPCESQQLVTSALQPFHTFHSNGILQVWYPVTTEMGKPSFQGPDCIKEIKLGKPKAGNDITQFFKRKKPDTDEEAAKKKTKTEEQP